MLLTDLPVEILELIAAYLKGGSDWSESWDDRDERLLDGMALALACRRTHQLGLGVLYHRVDIDRETGSDVVFALQTNKSSRRHVIRLLVDLNVATPSTISQSFAYLDRMRALALYGNDTHCAQGLTALVQQGSPDILREIRLIAHWRPSDSDFPTAFVACVRFLVNLEKLEVRFHDKWSGSFSSSRLAVLPPHVVLELSDDFDAASWFSCLDASRLRSLQYFSFYAQGSTHVAFFNPADNLEELTLVGERSLLGDLLIHLLPHFSKMSRLRTLCILGRSRSAYTSFGLGDARRALVFSALPRTLEVISIDILFWLECDPVDFCAYLDSQLQGDGRPGGELQLWESIERGREPYSYGMYAALYDFNHVVYTRQVDQGSHEYFSASREIC